MDNKTALMFKNLREAPFGEDFVDYLKQLSAQNYRAYKHDGFESGEMHRGYAICVDSLIDSFAECTQFIEKSKKKHLINEI